MTSVQSLGATIELRQELRRSKTKKVWRFCLSRRQGSPEEDFFFPSYLTSSMMMWNFHFDCVEKFGDWTNFSTSEIESFRFNGIKWDVFVLTGNCHTPRITKTKLISCITLLLSQSYLIKVGHLRKSKQIRFAPRVPLWHHNLSK